MITNEEFNIAYNNLDNKGIIYSVLSRYAQLIRDKDELEACGLRGLWKCLLKFDATKGFKFTSYLYMHVKWECQRTIKQFLDPVFNVEFIEKYDDNVSKQELTDFFLSMEDEERELMIKYFVDRYSYKELAEQYGISVEWIRKKVKNIQLVYN